MLAVDGLAIISAVHSFFSGSTRAAGRRENIVRGVGVVCRPSGRVINRLEKHGTSVERCHRPIALMLHIYMLCATD